MTDTTEQRLAALESHVAESSQALADITTAFEHYADSTGQALADIASALEKRDPELAKALTSIAQGMHHHQQTMASLVQALREAPAPRVDVKVMPAPVRSLLEGGGQIEMRIPAPAGGRDKVAFIRYIAPSSKKDT